MTGLLVQIAVSWVLLWIVHRKHLGVLGLMPAGIRLNQFLIAFAISLVCGGLFFLFTTLLDGTHWGLNPDATVSGIGAASWWTLRSLLFEELIFRGALLYIAIKKMGLAKALVLSSLAFGVYHWFTMGALGNPGRMFIVLVTTGIWGYVFALAFAKTGSMLFGIGLHFGWNLVQMVIFSQGVLGKQLLIGSGGEQVEGIPSLLVFLFMVFAVPFMGFLYTRRFSRTGNKEVLQQERQLVTVKIR
jgi:hypothetical protein